MGKTKKELREDSFVQFWYDTVEKIKPYLNLLTVIILVIAAAVVAWVVIRVLSERSEEAALAALGDSTTAEQLRNVPESYLKTSVGPMLVFSLAQKREAEDKPENREELARTWQRLLDLKPSDYFQLQAHMGLGKLALVQEKWQDALAHFEAAVSSPLTFMSAEAIWYKGWSLEKLNRTEDALNTYRSLLTRTEQVQGHLWTEMATYRLSQLERHLAGG